MGLRRDLLPSQPSTTGPRVDVDVELRLAATERGELTPQQIIEALLHSVVYCGFPRALNATFTAKKVFAERGLLPVA